MLEALISDVLSTRTTAEWEGIFADNDIPCGPVNTVAQAFNMPIIAERAVIRTAEHPTVGRVPVVRSPVRFVGRFEDAAIAPAPLLGEHTAEILANLLGYDQQRIETLAREGAISAPR